MRTRGDVFAKPGAHCQVLQNGTFEAAAER